MPRIEVSSVRSACRELPGSCPSRDIILGFDWCVTAIFILEVVLKLVKEDLTPWEYFKDSWNVFDFTIVVAGFALTGGLIKVIPFPQIECDYCVTDRSRPGPSTNAVAPAFENDQICPQVGNPRDCSDIRDGVYLLHFYYHHHGVLHVRNFGYVIFSNLSHILGPFLAVIVALRY